MSSAIGSSGTSATRSSVADAGISVCSPSAEVVLRRPPMRIFTIDDFDCAWIALAIRDALVHRKNIVISGSTGSGKTRLLEAILRLAGMTPARATKQVATVYKRYLPVDEDGPDGQAQQES